MDTDWGFMDDIPILPGDGETLKEVLMDYDIIISLNDSNRLPSADFTIKISLRTNYHLFKDQVKIEHPRRDGSFGGCNWDNFENTFNRYVGMELTYISKK